MPNKNQEYLWDTISQEQESYFKHMSVTSIYTNIQQTKLI